MSHEDLFFAGPKILYEQLILSLMKIRKIHVLIPIHLAWYGGNSSHKNWKYFTKKEIVHMKTTINPNDKKSNYFLNLQFELFPFAESRTISALPILNTIATRRNTVP